MCNADSNGDQTPWQSPMPALHADLPEKIRRTAADLGFSACGFADAQPCSYPDQVRSWIKEGFCADMGWFPRSLERRLDPCKTLLGARTLIMLAASYPPPPPRADPTSPVTAAYAQGMDYHDILEKRLDQLSSHLSVWIPGIRIKKFVDHGHLLEREHAARAGLGWQGKSTMLISRQLGTWFFLCALLLDHPLPPDSPHRNLCGTCTRCLDACPTRAIVAPYRLDARRCISYLTIEHRGSIPEELRPAIGNRLFGCDDCLIACPWNRFARECHDNEMPPLPLPDLHSILAMDEPAFSRLFAGRPIQRTGLAGLQRNALVVLGNTGSLRDLPAIHSHTASSSPILSEHACWAMRQIQQRDLERKENQSFL